MSGPKREADDETRDGPSARRRVLVVDDSVDVVDALAEFLVGEGFEVETAFDGPGALDRAARFDPDIVLLDIGLPGVDGYQVAARLRANGATSRAYLVALTGYGGADAEARARAAGFDVHLVKPARLSKLASVLARAPARGR
jgi:CheY-like chemotaxis protein